MTLTPWDIPAPNADDPSPRFVKPIPAERLHRMFQPRSPVNDDRPDLYGLLGSSQERRGILPTRRSLSMSLFEFAMTAIIVACIGFLIVSVRP